MDMDVYDVKRGDILMWIYVRYAAMAVSTEAPPNLLFKSSVLGTTVVSESWLKRGGRRRDKQELSWKMSIIGPL